jgi:predicted nucleic acid-binding protein
MIYVLDTDTFSDATFRARGLRARIDRERQAHEVALSVFTLLDALSGWYAKIVTAADATEVLRWVAQLRETQAFLAEFAVLTFDERAGDHFERLRMDKQAKKAGRKDLLIGCVALAYGATVVTRNRRHFSLIPGLQIADWSA